MFYGVQPNYKVLWCSLKQFATFSKSKCFLCMEAFRLAVSKIYIVIIENILQSALNKEVNALLSIIYGWKKKLKNERLRMDLELFGGGG